MDNHSSNDSSKVQAFVSLLTQHQSRIYSYILSFVANFNDADDLMQESTQVMWERFGQFEEGSNFLAWGIRIAHFRILEYFRAKKKNKKAHFSEQLIQEIEQDVSKRADLSKELLFYLAYCLKKLLLRDKDMIRLKYQKNMKIKEIAEYFGKSVQSIYQNVARIHEQLLSCTQKQIAKEGH